jgi:hypothetical protein
MAQEHGRGSDAFGVSVITHLAEAGGHRTNFQVEKWDVDQITWTKRRDYDEERLIGFGTSEPTPADFARLGCKPFETFLAEDCNLILDAGWQMMMNGVAGSAVTKFSNGAVGRIGGGDTGTAAAYTQTDLSAATGSTHRQWELINAVPTVGSTHSAGLVVAAQFPTTDGNFAWAEFGLDSGTAAGTGASTAPMFSRGTASPGTKTSLQTWNATITFTWT